MPLLKGQEPGESNAAIATVSRGNRFANRIRRFSETKGRMTITDHGGTRGESITHTESETTESTSQCMRQSSRVADHLSSGMLCIHGISPQAAERVCALPTPSPFPLVPEVLADIDR